jgi:CRISPR/Cas system type I-B associated protein Csh2 (Cas7 group RAMP superfamily)
VEQVGSSIEPVAILSLKEGSSVMSGDGYVQSSSTFKEQFLLRVTLGVFVIPSGSILQSPVANS